MTPMYQAFAGITATQLHRWKESRRFCGRCGHETEDSKTERAVVCPFCGQTEYPKICPAVIVAITDGDRIILSRYRVSNNPYRGYALIAGFVEIGETFEDTVRREVMEEVGLKVKKISVTIRASPGLFRYGDDRIFRRAGRRRYHPSPGGRAFGGRMVPQRPGAGRDHVKQHRKRAEDGL